MSTSQITMKNPTSILRIFDEEKAKEFYLTFLGFKVDWEHRFEENFPLYMQVSYGDCIIHLSEHHGDCCPGGAIRIETENLELFHSKLLSKNYKYARPGIETTPWHTREVSIRDPFGNRIIFFENLQH
ncbi:glyoxalase superfamily protein [Pullulanibacillus sp. KACC 23026]|uniref:glyoxalase superfamily protein n=1 Tax=Pullulanibacillus sp. KACC 23026 TaxID=3028315 RepID=UPI0023AFBA5A|nr:glyoxalase superfamily protein [Pullulanibacillus sp. KACC 23026]WEG13444.1 glyoxalase superfamily protein [Pullulanibacillus sp. KACC 23026]